MPARTVTDPESIRALAHPVRLRLLDFLADTSEATATECAEHLGESVASCSFHLRTLEKYGFIERAEPRGREKPWRIIRGGVDLRPTPEVPESLGAASELAAVWLSRETARFHAYLAQIERESDDWVQATTFTRSAFWATAEEAAELNGMLNEITARFVERETDPATRPSGARRVRLFAAVNPEPESDRG